MTDTTCPSCDAPAPARARRCARCGYRFVEDGAGERTHPRPTGRHLAVALGVAALVAVSVAGAALMGGGGEDDNAAAGEAAPPAHLDILSAHPLATRAAERLLKQRYIGVRNDESASVRCSGRVPKPAHSVRRCIVHYPGGVERRVVLLTSANGSEVLSKP
jgi:ribosomal protein L40E